MICSRQPILQNIKYNFPHEQPIASMTRSCCTLRPLTEGLAAFPPLHLGRRAVCPELCGGRDREDFLLPHTLCPIKLR